MVSNFKDNRNVAYTPFFAWPNHQYYDPQYNIAANFSEIVQLSSPLKEPILGGPVALLEP